MVRGVLLLAGWLLAVALHVAPATAAEDASARLGRALVGWQRLAAHFEQQVFDEAGNLLEDSRGEVVLARPDRFRWDYTEPYRQTIVADGKRVWVYDVALEQATVRPYAATTEMGLIAILEAPGRVAETFVASALADEDGIEWIRLTPREAGRFEFAWMDVGVDRQGLAGLRLADRLGQVSRIRLTGRRFDVDIDPVRFRFQPPPGVDVVEAGGP